MSTLTKRQSQILSLIHSISQAKGYSPTYRELMQQLGLRSTATLHKHIQNLKAGGHLKDTSKPIQTVKVPIIGAIAKGKKIELYARSESFELPQSYQDATATLYAFYAADSSFKEFGIIQQDLIIIKATQKCQGDQLLLAQSKSHGALIGRLKIHYGEHLLETDEATLSFEEEPLHIQGSLHSLHRHYHS